MRLVIIGQQDFGKAVLDAFLARGDDVLAVFCAPEKDGAKADPLRVAAQEKQITTYQFSSLKSPEAHEAMRQLRPDIGIMAYVLQFAPQDFVNIPRYGTIQYHPSLLPKYRGPSSINWPIIRGEKETGLTIFRPTDGLDEGPIILQQRVAIQEDDTLGSVYFNHLFPLGVQAMLDAADLVVKGQHREVVQDENQASYEGWCRSEEARINWHNHVNDIYNLIRGCNPAPGAWTTLSGKKIQLFDVKKHVFRTFGQVQGKIGEVSQITEESFSVTAQGGQIEVFKLKHQDAKKMNASEFVQSYQITLGTLLNS
ncbi:methionyl-tRNA formyltransferase [Ferrovum sp. PN-J185]|uniref:methionyl-tRNA formyltransferase n=1 Tax=Ferrovum sp. PN-J185 TaxID=1356306 RepID=UPI001E57E557|nr:methionyl-tRNA formyltransferase [Ferrovum sp. PN-J185]MCC6068954.1 methionyl-tRNA formyltransferase [Ferrovum sp. PN-J185]MDE1891066.1 methionyl-tRNA formyltransferase [Betaproteobacteria bacterium]MDE2055622.1 methionyl-tRNA formyltransferase [Betaproteobacteria bacterium]